jgi:hypothetical protein
MLRIFRCSTTRVRSVSPAAMYSILDGWRQSFFVGKLTIDPGPPARTPLVTNIRPIVTSPCVQAFA